MTNSQGSSFSTLRHQEFPKNLFQSQVGTQLVTGTNAEQKSASITYTTDKSIYSGGFGISISGRFQDASNYTHEAHFRCLLHHPTALSELPCKCAVIRHQELSTRFCLSGAECYSAMHFVFKRIISCLKGPLKVKLQSQLMIKNIPKMRSFLPSTLSTLFFPSKEQK